MSPTSPQRCAIKVESSLSPKQVLKMEVVVLKRLQNSSSHVCALLGCGRTDKINYIVMSLLGPNLSELRKQRPKQRFSLSTTLRVGLQVIAAVHDMHNCGFLHRDIKPSNFAIGSTAHTRRTCYLLDFGLARQYTTPTGEIRAPRPVAGFRGTVRYASTNAHESKDLGRHDDLWSVFYMLVELACSELPWKRIRDKETAGKFKLSYDHGKLVKLLPPEFYDFLDHLRSLNYFEKPDYKYLSTLLLNAMRCLGVSRADPYDWEQDVSVRSITIASMGSTPALRSINSKGMQESGIEGEHSKTNVSMCLSKNEENRDNPAKENMGQFVRHRPLISSSSAEKHLHQVEKKAQESRCNRGKRRDRQLNPVLTSDNLPPLSQPAKGLPPQPSKVPSPLIQATQVLHTQSQADSLDQFFDTKAGAGKPQERSESNAEQRHISERPKKASPKVPVKRSFDETDHKGTQKNSSAARKLSGKRSSLSSSRSKPELEEKDSIEYYCNNTHSPDVHPESKPVPWMGYADISHPVDNLATAHPVPPDESRNRDDALQTQTQTMFRDKNKGNLHFQAGIDEGILDSKQSVNAGETNPHVDRDVTKLREETSGIEEYKINRKEGNLGSANKNGGLVKMPVGNSEDTFKNHTPKLVDEGGAEVEENSGNSNGSQEAEPRAYEPPLSPKLHPLEFNVEQPLKMWGCDPTLPLSLPQELLHGNRGSSSCSNWQENRTNAMTFPQPPNHPPPSNYTLLSARRKRFRKPSNL